MKKKEIAGDVAIQNEEELRCNIRRIGLKQVVDHSKDLITRKQYAKIKEFKNDHSISHIRKADKCSTFVIMSTADYKIKRDAILQDRNKFKRIRKDLTKHIKSVINYIVCLLNHKYSENLSKLEEHCEPGYLYGNPKIHKNKQDPPLRPIISQIGIPVYHIANYLKSIIVK